MMKSIVTLFAIYSSSSLGNRLLLQQGTEPAFIPIADPAAPVEPATPAIPAVPDILAVPPQISQPGTPQMPPQPMTPPQPAVAVPPQPQPQPPVIQQPPQAPQWPVIQQPAVPIAPVAPPQAPQAPQWPVIQQPAVPAAPQPVVPAVPVAPAPPSWPQQPMPQQPLPAQPIIPAVPVAPQPQWPQPQPLPAQPIIPALPVAPQPLPPQVVVQPVVPVTPQQPLPPQPAVPVTPGPPQVMPWSPAASQQSPFHLTNKLECKTTPTVYVEPRDTLSCALGTFQINDPSDVYEVKCTKPGSCYKSTISFNLTPMGQPIDRLKGVWCLERGSCMDATIIINNQRGGRVRVDDIVCDKLNSCKGTKIIMGTGAYIESGNLHCNTYDACPGCTITMNGITEPCTNYMW